MATILFSSLIHVFASVLSDWSNLKEICETDTALCNTELRPEYHELLSSNKVIINSVAVILYDIDAEDSSMARALPVWMAVRGIRLRGYQFQDIHFCDSIHVSSGLLQTHEAQYLSFEESDLLPYAEYSKDASELVKMYTTCEQNLSKFINDTVKLNRLELDLSFTSMESTLRVISPSILGQLTGITLSWENNHSSASDVISLLSSVCVNLRTVEINRSTYGLYYKDFFDSAYITALLEANKWMETLICNTMSITNSLLISICKHRNLKKVILSGGSDIYCNRLEASGREPISLDAIRQLCGHCLITGTVLKVYIQDAVYIHNYTFESVPSIPNGLHIDFLASDSKTTPIFMPSNAQFALFFRDLGRMKLLWLSICGFHGLSSAVIDQISDSFPEILKLRILNCGIDFVKRTDNSIRRLCENGAVEYVDFDGHCSFNDFKPYLFHNSYDDNRREVYFRHKSAGYYLRDYSDVYNLDMFEFVI